MEDAIAWPLNSVIYQIYPRSFYDKSGEGIGDIAGITEKIDYLHELGITAIWLSPVYPSPQADFGYDVANFIDIDPIYGSINDFDILVQKAHSRGIKVMMDFIPNHSSNHHAWFMESKTSKNNPKRNWYIWRDGKKDGSPPNNWLSVFGGSAWEYDSATDQYYYHAFDMAQPDLNWRNPKVVDAMMDSMRFWYNRGVDGFRVDAIYWLFEDPNFEDEKQNPNFDLGIHAEYDRLLHQKTFKYPETLDIIQKMVEVCKEYSDRFLVTEAYLGIPDLITMYQKIDWEFYAPFNFSFITLPWKAEIHKGYIDEFDAKIGASKIPVYVLGNHDVHRVATRIGIEQARVAALIQMTLRGLPFIYQGEEIGMTDGEIPIDAIQDPQEKGNPGIGIGRDPERTPMQWNDTSHAGFSHQGIPWLPVASNYKEINVENQKNDPHSILNLYKRLIRLKRSYASIRQGAYLPIAQPSDDVFAYIRQNDRETTLILANMANERREILIPEKGEILCDTHLQKIGEHIDLSTYTLEPNEGLVVLLDTN
jgi:alpha-glucosidase